MERMPNRTESAQRFSPEKEELLALEREGKYVFHGTGADVDMLEPRQAMDMETGPDGAPAVFASNKAEYAIFMAIINKYNCLYSSHTRSGYTQRDDGTHELHFDASKATMAQLSDSASGWVYVFNKEDFASHPDKEGIEFVSHAAVAPARKIRVARRDLPEGFKSSRTHDGMNHKKSRREAGESPEVLILEGKGYHFVAHQRDRLSAIYASDDSYVRIGSPERIHTEIALHKHMEAAGFPVARLLGEGNGKGKHISSRLLWATSTPATSFPKNTTHAAPSTPVRSSLSSPS